MFCAYPETKKQYIEARGDILLSSPAPPNGMPRGGQTSDPTYAKVVSLTRIQEMERQIRAVEQCIYEFGSQSDIVKKNLWENIRLIDIPCYYSERTMKRIKSKFMERLGYILGELG